MDNYRIVQYDHDTFDEDGLNTLFQLHSQIVDRYDHLNRHPSLECFKTDFISTINGVEKSLFILHRGEIPFGLITVNQAFDWASSPQLQLNFAFVEKPPLDDPTLTSILTQSVSEYVKRHEKVAIIHYNNELDDFAHRLDGKRCLHANYFKLAFEDIDVQRLVGACDTYSSMNTDLILSYHSGIDDAHMAAYCDLFMETQEDMPDTNEPAFIRYPLNIEKQRQNNILNASNGIHHHCMMVHDMDGMLVAMSNVRTNDKDHRFPYQFMIGVKKQFRGRHLGKWMYAEMYRRLKTEVTFDSVLVCHHPENTSAIAISEWVGYRYAYCESLTIVKI